MALISEFKSWCNLIVGSSSICSLMNSVNRYCGTVLSDNDFATDENLPICGKLQVDAIFLLYTMPLKILYGIPSIWCKITILIRSCVGGAGVDDTHTFFLMVLILSRYANFQQKIHQTRTAECLKPWVFYEAKLWVV